jgi:hypothetical protein
MPTLPNGDPAERHPLLPLRIGSGSGGYLDDREKGKENVMNESNWELRQKRLDVIEKATVLLDRMLEEDRLMSSEEDAEYKEYLKVIHELDIGIDIKSCTNCGKELSKK